MDHLFRRLDLTCRNLLDSFHVRNRWYDCLEPTHTIHVHIFFSHVYDPTTDSQHHHITLPSSYSLPIKKRGVSWGLDMAHPIGTPYAGTTSYHPSNIHLLSSLHMLHTFPALSSFPVVPASVPSS